MKAVLYGAVRVNAAGTEFAAIDEYSVVRDLVPTLVGTTATEMPEWHAANPVRRIARFNVREALPRKPRRARVPPPAARLVFTPYGAAVDPTSRAAEMIHFKRIWRNGSTEYALIRVRDSAELGRVYRDDSTGWWMTEINGAARARHATLAAAKTAARRDAA